MEKGPKKHGLHGKVRKVHEDSGERSTLEQQVGALAKELEKERAECEQWRQEAFKALAKVKEHEEDPSPTRAAREERGTTRREEELERELDSVRKELSKRDRLHEQQLAKERDKAKRAKAEAEAAMAAQQLETEKQHSVLVTEIGSLKSELRELKKGRAAQHAAAHRSANADAFMKSLSESRYSEVEELRVELREAKARAKEFERKYEKAEGLRLQLLDERAQHSVQESKQKRKSLPDATSVSELQDLAEERLEQIRMLQSDRKQLLSQLEQLERDARKLRAELCGTASEEAESAAWSAGEGESEEEAEQAQSVDVQDMFELPSGETLLTYYSCATNDGRRGYLYLTQSFVCFAVVLSHLRDIPRHVIPLASIERMEVLNTRWIRIPGRGRAVRMVLSSGEKITFRGFLLRASAVAAIRDQAMKLAHMIVVKENVDE